MRTAAPAAATCGDALSSSVWTAIAARPIAWTLRRMRRAISPRLAIRTLWMVMAASHAEHAAVDRGQRRAGDDVEGEAQDGAGLGGVDDAVVPEPGGGVVGAALPVVVLLDRPAELRLVLGAPGPAA